MSGVYLLDAELRQLRQGLTQEEALTFLNKRARRTNSKQLSSEDYGQLMIMSQASTGAASPEVMSEEAPSASLAGNPVALQILSNQATGAPLFQAIGNPIYSTLGTRYGRIPSTYAPLEADRYKWTADMGYAQKSLLNKRALQTYNLQRRLTGNDGGLQQYYAGLEALSGIDNNFTFDGRYFHLGGSVNPISKNQLKGLLIGLKTQIVNTDNDFERVTLYGHIKQAQFLKALNSANRHLSMIAKVREFMDGRTSVNVTNSKDRAWVKKALMEGANIYTGTAMKARGALTSVEMQNKYVNGLGVTAANQYRTALAKGNNIRQFKADRKEQSWLNRESTTGVDRSVLKSLAAERAAMSAQYNIEVGVGESLLPTYSQWDTSGSMLPYASSRQGRLGDSTFGTKYSTIMMKNPDDAFGRATKIPSATLEAQRKIIYGNLQTREPGIKSIFTY